jgi:glycosyltransferase involved in cell wall biosynthesis
MSKPLISVILSVYNGEKYLAEAIDSILNQTYKNFEFIIINDGSTDRSLEIVKSYSDERMVLISRENRGLVESLNEGIEKAKGRYIARMDADDISLETRFEEQMTFMEADKGIGVCGTAIIGFGEGMKEHVSTYEIHNSRLQTELLFSSVFAHPTVMIRREILLKHELKYEKESLHAEDFALWVRLAQYTKLANLKKPLLKYRILQDSITREADKDTEDRYKTIKAIFENSLKKLDIQNSEEENRLHFNLTVNNRIAESDISFEALNHYFFKIVQSNSKKKIYNNIELKKVLGKKWLWNLYYKKEFKAFFSKYFLYGLWSMIKK